MQMQHLFFLALAGACGAVARFALAECMYIFFGRSLPYGTFVVNMLGCFLFGIVWDMHNTLSLMRESTRLIILVGFMGSFTTFSSLIFESDVLVRDGFLWASMANMGLSFVFGMLALRLGLFVPSFVRSVVGSVL